MTRSNFRCYPRNSPRAAGRILAAALIANGEIKAAEWERLFETNALARLGLLEQQWHRLLFELREDLLKGADATGHGVIDASTLADWLGEVDDLRLRALVMVLCAQIIEADGEVQPGESAVFLAAITHWVLPIALRQPAEVRSRERVTRRTGSRPVLVPVLPTVC